MITRPKLKAYKHAKVLSMVSFGGGEARDILAPSKQAWFLIRPGTYTELRLRGHIGSSVFSSGYFLHPSISACSPARQPSRMYANLEAWHTYVMADVQELLCDMFYNGVVFTYRNEYEQSLRVGFNVPGKKFKSILDAAVLRYINELEVDDAAMDTLN